MEHASEDAPLSTENRAESRQGLVQPSGTTGASNSRALKIAGITTLACLLLAAQAFTAYMVFDQKHQIQEMRVNNYKLERQMDARSRVAPEKVVMPIGSLPLMDLFDDDKTPENGPTTEPPKRDVTTSIVEEQLRELIRDYELPQMNQTFLTNLETLKQQVTESDWKSFESWLRSWMIFQKAQKTPSPSPKPDFFEEDGLE